MDAIIGDCSILTGLAQRCVLQEPIRLPYRLVVPDVLLADESISQGVYEEPILVEMRVRPGHLAPDGVERASTYQTRYPGLSTTEICALVLAEAAGSRSVLLTEEPLLGRIAEAHRVEVRGLLWLLDEIHRHSAANRAPPQAALWRGG